MSLRAYLINHSIYNIHLTQLLHNRLILPSVAQRQAGFTLIEIMVVVIIIALFAAFVGLNINQDTGRTAKLESSRFLAVVNEVRDEAVIAGENFVMSVDERAQSYRFDLLRQNTTEGENDDALFKVRTIPDGVDLEWNVFEQFDDDDKKSPRVLISSLGEITPFELRIGGKDIDYFVFVNDESELEIRSRGGIR